MKTKRTFLIALFFSIYFGINAQEFTHKFHKDLKEINVVVLNLEGNVSISPSNENEIQIVSLLNPSGSVWGLKAPKERPEFKSNSKKSKDTLFIYTPKRFSYTTVGINTYSEKIETLIQVSSTTEIIISEADDIVIEDGFTELVVQKAKKINFLNANKLMLKKIYCESEDKLLVNGLNKANSFEFLGAGFETYLLKANNIELSIK